MNDAPLSAAMTVEQLWQPVPGGSGTYIRELATALVDHGRVRLSGVRARGRSSTPLDRRGLPARMELRTSALPRRAMYEAWSRLRLPRLPGPRPDVVHATTWAIPPRSAPLVVTVHDLAFQRTPEHFTPRGVAFFDRALQIVTKEADIVVVPSVATRNDVVAAGIAADRVRVIPHGVTALPVSEGDVAAFQDRQGLQRPYVMWCGAIEPRKNLGVLLDAFAVLVDETDLDLVLAGPDGWGGAAEDRHRRGEGGIVHAPSLGPVSEWVSGD